MKCVKCNTELKHLHDCAHGMPEMHISGTERYECVKCGDVFYKDTGVKIGLEYFYD